MYKVSDFFVSHKLNDKEILIYSTLTTSLIVLEYNMYEDIFVNGYIDKYEDNISELLEMGLIYNNKENQHQMLEDVRQSLINNECGMRSITIAPTMECNARCYYCFENGSQKNKMNFKTAKQLVNFINENCSDKRLGISWFGGEPLLATDIIDYITDELTIKKIDFDSTVTSNGSLITAELLKKFKKWKVHKIQITVDAIGNEYNKIKNYCGELKNVAFETVIKNIHFLLENNFRTHIRVNYNPNKIATAEQTLEYLYKKFCRYDSFYMYAAPLDLKNDENVNNNHLLEFMQKQIKYGYEYNKNFIQGNVTDDERILNSFMMLPNPLPCNMNYKYKFAVDSNGDLYKCHRFLGRKEYSSGNVFSGIKENEIYNDFYTSKLADKDCNKCKLLPICQGGCHANRKLYTKDNACSPIKGFIEQLIYMYYKEVSN